MAKGVPIEGSKLADLWRAARVSQDSLAAAVGMTRSGVTRLMRPGVRGVHADNLNALARFFNLSPAEFEKRVAPDPGDVVRPGASSGRTAVARTNAENVVGWIEAYVAGGDAAARVGLIDALEAAFAGQVSQPAPATAGQSDPSGTRGVGPVRKTPPKAAGGVGRIGVIEGGKVSFVEPDE